jgi:archaellum component FlaC
MGTDTQIQAEEVTTEEESTTVTAQAKSDKVITQADFDREIKNRLARQKSTFDKEKEGWETERSGLTATNDKLSKIVVERYIAQMTKDFSPFALEIFNKLPLDEQLETLDKPEAVESLKKPVITSTPRASDKQKEFVPHKVERVI